MMSIPIFKEELLVSFKKHSTSVTDLFINHSIQSKFCITYMNIPLFGSFLTRNECFPLTTRKLSPNKNATFPSFLGNRDFTMQTFFFILESLAPYTHCSSTHTCRGCAPCNLCSRSPICSLRILNRS